MSVVSLTILNCAQAGVDESELPQISINDAGRTTVEGYLGVGALNNSDVNIINVTDGSNTTVLYSTTTDSDGFFSFDLDNSFDGRIMIVASGGVYVDPFSFTTISASTYELSALYDAADIIESGEVYITPFSTLFVALFDGLYHQTSLASDPYLYAKSIFLDVFDLNSSETKDIYLKETDDFTEEDALYTLYNLAFSYMAINDSARSGLDLVDVFSQSLANDCTLITDDQQTSSQYLFHTESFREDYLNALTELQSNPRFAEISDGLDIDSLVDDIRDSSNLIFGFKEYNENN